MYIVTHPLRQNILQRVLMADNPLYPLNEPNQIDSACIAVGKIRRQLQRLLILCELS